MASLTADTVQNNTTQFKLGHPQLNTGRTHFGEGHIPWNKGKKFSPESIEKMRLAKLGKRPSAETKKKMSLAKDGAKAYQWKGDSVGYNALHTWVRKLLGNPQECCYCGKTVDEGKIHWANVSGDYKRDLSDFMSLCVPCHKKYDLGRKDSTKWRH